MVPATTHQMFFFLIEIVRQKTGRQQGAHCHARRRRRCLCTSRRKDGTTSSRILTDNSSSCSSEITGEHVSEAEREECGSVSLERGVRVLDFLLEAGKDHVVAGGGAGWCLLSLLGFLLALLMIA